MTDLKIRNPDAEDRERLRVEQLRLGCTELHPKTTIILEGSPPIKIHVLDRPVAHRWVEVKDAQPREQGYREFGAEFLYRHGLELTGNVLNCGSAWDRFDYSRFFPKCTRYRLLDKKQVTTKLEFILADVTDIPLPPNSEDCIVAFAFFFLLNRSEQVKALQEFSRVLKPDGLLLIDFCGPGSYYTRAHDHTHHYAIELCEKDFQLLDVDLYCQSHSRKGPASPIKDKHLFATFIKAKPKK